MKAVYAIYGGLLYGLLMHGPQARATGSEASDTAEVTAIGVGLTAADAEKNALLSAVQQVVGLYVDAETFIQNEQLLFDQILSVSSGFVGSYSLINPPQKRLIDGLYEAQVHAVVHKSKVMQKLHDSNLTTISVTGSDAWAQAFTELELRKDGRQLLERYLDGLPQRLLTGKLLTDDGEVGAQPAVAVDHKAGRVWCAWNVVVSFDREKYYSEEVPRLRKILEAISLRHSKHEIRRYTPFEYVNKGVNNSMTYYGGWQSVPVGEKVRWVMDDVRYASKVSLIEDLPDIDRESEIIVFLNTSTDGTRQTMGFSWYVLDRAQYWGLFDKVATPTVARLSLMDANQHVLAEETFPLDITYLFPSEGEVEKTTHKNPIVAMPVECLNASLFHVQTAERWIIGTYKYSAYMLPPGDIVITPEFRTKDMLQAPLSYGAGQLTRGYAYVDSLSIRIEASLLPDDLKNISKASISFVQGNLKRNQ